MSKEEQCPRCKHVTLSPMKGEISIEGKLYKVLRCSRCWFMKIQKPNEERDNEVP